MRMVFLPLPLGGGWGEGVFVLSMKEGRAPLFVMFPFLNTPACMKPKNCVGFVFGETFRHDELASRL